MARAPYIRPKLKKKKKKNTKKTVFTVSGNRTLPKFTGETENCFPDFLENI